MAILKRRIRRSKHKSKANRRRGIKRSWPGIKVYTYLLLRPVCLG
jgi:hypothetical protein